MGSRYPSLSSYFSESSTDSDSMSSHSHSHVPDPLESSSSEVDFSSEANSQSFDFFARTVRSPRGSTMPSIFDMFGGGGDDSGGSKAANSRASKSVSSMFDPPSPIESAPKSPAAALASKSTSKTGSSSSLSSSMFTSPDEPEDQDLAMLQFQAMLYKDQKTVKASLIEEEALIIPHIHHQSQFGPWDSTRPKLGITNFVGIIPWEIPVDFEDGQTIDSYGFLYDEDLNSSGGASSGSSSSDGRLSVGDSSLRLHQRRASALQIQALLENQEKYREREKERMEAEKEKQESYDSGSDSDSERDQKSEEMAAESRRSRGSGSATSGAIKKEKSRSKKEESEPYRSDSDLSEREESAAASERSRAKSSSKRVDSDSDSGDEAPSWDRSDSKSKSRSGLTSQERRKHNRSSSGVSVPGSQPPYHFRRHSSGVPRLSPIPHSQSTAANAGNSSVSPSTPSSSSPAPLDRPDSLSRLNIRTAERDSDKKTGRSTPSSGRQAVESPASLSRSSSSSSKPPRSLSPIAGKSGLTLTPLTIDSEREREEYSACDTPDLVARIKELEVRMGELDRDSSSADSERRSHQSQMQRMMAELMTRMGNEAAAGEGDGNTENKMKWIEEMLAARTPGTASQRAKKKGSGSGSGAGSSSASGSASKPKTFDPSILNSMLAGDESPRSIVPMTSSISQSANAAQQPFTKFFNAHAGGPEELDRSRSSGARPLNPLSPHSGAKRTQPTSSHKRTSSTSSSRSGSAASSTYYSPKSDSRSSSPSNFTTVSRSSRNAAPPNLAPLPGRSSHSTSAADSHSSASRVPSSSSAAPPVLPPISKGNKH